MAGSNPLVPFQNSIGGDQFGPHLNTIGTAYVVANKDALTAADHPDDPYLLALGLDATGNKTILLTNPGFTYLDLGLIASSTAAPTIVTPPKIKVYGMANELQINGTPNFLPHQYDTTANRWPNFQSDANANYYTATWKIRTQGIWVPLLHPTTGVHEQVFPSTFHINTYNGGEFTDTSTNVISQAVGPIVYAAGCTKLLVVVSVAGSITNGTAAMVLGRFIK